MACNCLSNHGVVEVRNLQMLDERDSPQFRIFVFECLRCGHLNQMVVWGADGGYGNDDVQTAQTAGATKHVSAYT